MSDSYTLITAAAIPGMNQLEDFPVPILAAVTLSYIGEPVALLVGPNVLRLEEYAAQCRVIADAEEGVFSSHAHAPGAMATRHIIMGDTQPGAVKTIVQGVYRTGIQEHWYAEPQGARAAFADASPAGEKFPDKMVIYTATQWPVHVKRSVAGVLGCSLDLVVVEPASLGIHLDGKIWYPSLISCHAALGTFITGKPVQVLLTREEDFRYSPKRNGTEIEIRSALGEGGELLETEITVRADLGAQGVFVDEILDRTCLGSLGAYTYSQVRINGVAAQTNIPPQGPLGGFGLSQGFFAMERHVSRIADTLRQDPAEWRKNHFLRRKGTLAMGLPLNEQVPAEQVLDTAAAMSDYYRKWASYELLRSHRRLTNWAVKDEPLRGIGIAVAYQGSGFLYNDSWYNGNDMGSCTVELTLEKDGSLEIRSGIVSSTHGYTEIWRNIAVAILGVDGNLVRIPVANTDAALDSGPASSSWNCTVLTTLVEHGCLAIRKQRFRDPLPITVQRSYRPVKKMNWAGKFFDKNALAHLGWGAAVVEVEMDTVTYAAAIRGVWLGIDGGRILAEKQARRSLKTAAIQALGWASREQLSYEDGKIPDTFIFNYDLPAPLDIPPIQVNFITHDTVNPKGIGELPFSVIPSAYLQAVSQAMDHPFEKIPLSAADVWEAGKRKHQEAGG
jgi:CO/xanthine dehydrogenase Mo-binding subunit